MILLKMATNTHHLNHLLFLYLCVLCCLVSKCYGNEIKGMFVFGSSLVDNGNNEFLQNSSVKADYLPYGLDFPLGPSGRYTNGRNFIDLLGENLKLPTYIPVFNHPSTKGDNILHGVNFASGGSGILDETGAISGNVTSLSEQIRNFEKVTLPDLNSKGGVSVSDYLFVVGSGGNDYFDYFLGRSNRTPEAFTFHVTTTLSQHLKKLYSLGGRKFLLIAVYPNGCSPVVKSRFPTVRGIDCVEIVNQAVRLYNIHLSALIHLIKMDMPGSNLVVFNAYKVMMDIIQSSTYKEFSEKSFGCCEVNEAGVLCKKGGSACKDRSKYVYFDGLHPTEAVNIVLANKAYASDDQDSEVYPMNVKQLSQI